MENVYVEESDILIGASGEPAENLTGFIARARLFDRVFSANEVKTVEKKTSA